MKILYIEDNDVQGKIAKRMLEAMGGHEVVIALDGPAALETVTTWQPDVIITDRRLPKMTGPEIIAHVKNEPTLMNIPVIMLSADLMSKAKEEALKAGADAFFTKPIDYKSLNEHLTELVPNG